MYLPLSPLLLLHRPSEIITLCAIISVLLGLFFPKLALIHGLGFVSIQHKEILKMLFYKMTYSQAKKKR